jgi:hypothetical protein
MTEETKEQMSEAQKNESNKPIDGYSQTKKPILNTTHLLSTKTTNN